MSYIKYFVQYPGAFDVFFIEKMSGHIFTGKFQELIDRLYGKIFAEDWNAASVDKENGELSAMIMMHEYSLHGLLLYYINRRIPSDYAEFMENADMLMTNILK
jgi:hypothetical protein